MNDAGIKVKNMREINRVLKNVGVPASAIKDAGKKAAASVISEAKALVPVRSGKLRNTIRPGATARGKVTIRAGNNTTVQYANPIHWGWYKRKIAPQPFFIKALGYTREEIYNTYFEQLERLITEEYAKAKIG
jgi:HK97 gp10 family phage protein